MANSIYFNSEDSVNSFNFVLLVLAKSYWICGSREATSVTFGILNKLRVKENNEKRYLLLLLTFYSESYYRIY